MKIIAIMKEILYYFFILLSCNSISLCNVAQNMSYQVEALPNSFADVGEGPHWDCNTQSLYYIDMYGPFILRYDFKENKIYKTKIENETISTFVIPIENKPNFYAVGLGRKLGIIEWNGLTETCQVKKIVFDVEIEKEYFENRFNDAKADPMGRFVGGTMRTDKAGDIFEKRLGKLYQYDGDDENGMDKQPIVLKDDVGVSNGLTWNVKTKKFYYIDSVDLEVKEYDYDIETGNISNSKVLIDFRVNGERPKFVPDGMTIDSEGFLYVATFGNSVIYKVNPINGQILMVIQMPVEDITSVAFGGPNLDILFATTASKGIKPKPAGECYKICGLGAKGLVMNKLKLTI